MKALARFEESYLDYRPEKGQTADKITRDSYAILGDILGENGGTAMFQGPMRLAVMAVRGRHVLNTDRRVPLGVGLAAAALGNMAHRSALGLFFERALFADPRSDCSYTAWSGFPMRRLNLTADNLPHAIMASCSIPMLLNGITIPGAPKGLYRDGGIIDYHFDLPFFHHDPDSLVLYPHFTDRIIAGWFDKHLGWRKARAGNASNVVLVAPSAEFVSRLPYGKIPDRKDFTTLETEDRIRYWRLVLDETERLSDAFETLIETGQFAGQVQPILGEAE
ncbi:hypothetical protein JCM17844_24510 [Iodidimonas gelatinilytica]|uniref:Uncharacterized protein n=1 Tax=Iodidimonas gelatinilytica TaxID=1236966 RepID=A0A5A7MT15_9PROT|nr:patatin-like phospholipase family protein [Iodidimonas gelatinilytica]GEQ98814.1 hypothetical protein JCM17844_24510 [Iodidimonas gelatinilytica]